MTRRQWDIVQQAILVLQRTEQWGDSIEPVSDQEFAELIDTLDPHGEFTY